VLLEKILISYGKCLRWRHLISISRFQTIITRQCEAQITKYWTIPLFYAWFPSKQSEKSTQEAQKTNTQTLRMGSLCFVQIKIENVICVFRDFSFFLLQIAKKFPIFIHLFRRNEAPLMTIRKLQFFLKPEFSEDGTNTRKFEGEMYSVFVHYLREAASKWWVLYWHSLNSGKSKLV